MKKENAQASLAISFQGNVSSREPSEIIELTNDEKKEAETTASMISADPFRETEEFLREANVYAGLLPERLRRKVVDFKHDGNKAGVLLIKGMAMDKRIPPTPTTTNSTVNKETFKSECTIGTVGALLGDLVGYAQEKNGQLWQSLNPTKENERKQTSESSATQLTWHTEVAFHRFGPDHVILYGLRQDPGKEAKTLVASIRNMLGDIPLRVRKTLSQKLFRTGIDPSFGNESNEPGTGPLLSILSGAPSDPYFLYDQELMVGETPEAKKALDDLAALVDRKKQAYTICPGDVLIIDNRRTAHARSPFKAYYDGNDRWLERVSVVRDLRQSILDRAVKSRIINSEFSGSAVKAGVSSGLETTSSTSRRQIQYATS